MKLARLAKGKRAVARRFGPFVWRAPRAVFARLGYLAGEDAARARAVEAALAGGGLVWCVRGGFGATRILERIDWRRAARKGAILMGYSDITALHAAFDAVGGTAVSGPMLAADLARGGSKRTWDSLAAFFEGRPDRFSFRGRFLRGGARLEGGIVAANLEVLTRLAGTRFYPRVRGRVVFLEEVEEEPYRLDRALTHLRMAGGFQGARGIVFGSLSRCRPETPRASLSLKEVLARFARENDLPVATGFPFGHGGTNTLLPWNGRVRLVARPGGRIEGEVKFES